MSSLRPRVLVTGAGGPAGVGVLRALAASNLELYAADIDPYAQGLYGVPAQQRLLLPRGDDPDFAARVHMECAARGISVLFPTVEAELMPLVGARTRLAADGITLVACSSEALEICLDKWRLATALAGRSYLPRTELLDGRFASSGWDFPVFVKPRRGSGSDGARVLDVPDEIRALPQDGSLIVQDLLPGEEFSVDALTANGADGAAAVYTVVRQRLKIDSGIAVTSRVVRNDALSTATRELVRDVGAGPICNVQFRHDRDDVPKLLEINPRVPGTIALSVAAGINMPAIAVADALGLAHEPPHDVVPIAMVRALEDRVVSRAELDDMVAMRDQAGTRA